MKSPVERIKYTGDIQALLNKICESFGVGTLKDFSIVNVGYEDCNIIVETEAGKFLAKIFAKARTIGDIQRYVRIMEAAGKAGVQIPELLTTAQKQRLLVTESVSLVLMRFIDGKTFLELDRAPDDSELTSVIEQAARISTIAYQPPYLFDSWAIPNILKMFEKVKPFIISNDLPLVERAIQLFTTIPISELPQCFVHGDFTKANILKGDDGKIYVLDFSVSNWYPRIQELAVIAANLMAPNKVGDALSQRCEHALFEYEKLMELTPIEKKSLYHYAVAGVAMEFLGAHQEKYVNGNDTEETEYWMTLGRTGLQQALKG